jgi:hypothetical protein
VLQRTGKGFLALATGGHGALVASRVALPADAWHTLLVRATVRGGSRGVQVWLDGRPVTALATNQALGSKPIDGVTVGESAPVAGWDAAFDDVAVGTRPL